MTTENTLKSTDHTSPSPKKMNWLAIFLFIFLVASITANFFLYETRVKVIKEKEYITIEKNNLQTELDSLVLEYDNVKYQYGELNNRLSGQDSLIQQQVQEIQKLIAQQADYRKIKKQLNYLRNIQQGYVSQLDSLFTVSKSLNEENIKIKGDFEKEKMLNSELAQAKKSLTEQVNIASVLNAYSISGIGVRMKGEEEIVTDKAKKSQKIKICFTVAKNAVVQAGEKDMYVRVAQPDNTILTIGLDDKYSFYTADSMQLQYSIRKKIKYNNTAQQVCAYWNTVGELVPGTYYATIYADGVMIGESNFQLK